jgi:hypothetical protein
MDAPRQTNVSRTERRTRSPLTRPIAGLLPASAMTAALIAITGLLAAGAPAVQAQNAAPAAVPSANPSSTAPDSSGSQPNPGQAAAGGQPPAGAGAGQASGAGAGQGAAAGASQQGAAAGKDGKPAVCFKLTGRCVEQTKASAAKEGTPANQTGSTTKPPLNLTAPDVRTVVPAEELNEPLPTSDQITETQESQTVQVKTDQGVPPDVPGGFGALWWAMNHPSQAWRILAPAE